MLINVMISTQWHCHLVGLKLAQLMPCFREHGKPENNAQITNQGDSKSSIHFKSETNMFTFLVGSVQADFLLG